MPLGVNQLVLELQWPGYELNKITKTALFSHMTLPPLFIIFHIGELFLFLNTCAHVK